MRVPTLLFCFCLIFDALIGQHESQHLYPELEFQNEYSQLDIINPTVNYRSDHDLLVESTIESYDGWSGGWGIRDSAIYCYDANENLNYSKSYRMTDGEFRNSYKTTSFYDNKQNQRKWILQNWYEERWNFTRRAIKTYDDNNNQITSLNQDYDEDTWVNNLKYLYSYDQNNNEILSVKLRWNENFWDFELRTEYEYDQNGNVIERITQVWSDNEWENSAKQSSEFNSNSDQLSRKEFVWRENAWVNEGQYLYEYDQNNILTSYFEQEWIGNNWENSRRLIYSMEDNVQSIIEDNWDDTKWRPSYRYIRYYDDNDNLSIYEYYAWDEQTWNWEIYNRFRYRYGENSIDEKASDIQSFDIIPNPNNGEFSLDLSNSTLVDPVMYVYTPSGQLVYKQRIHSKNPSLPIRLESLHQGLYFLKLMDQDQFTTERLFISR